MGKPASASAGADAPDPALLTTGDSPAPAGAADPTTSNGTVDVPVELPGPGAGALQVAEPSQGFATRPLDQESRDPRTRAPLDRVDTAGSILDGARGVLDASRVGGTRTVRAATQILHDGRRYGPGDELPVDFATYTELVQIGAVVAIAWDDQAREV